VDVDMIEPKTRIEDRDVRDGDVCHANSVVATASEHQQVVTAVDSVDDHVVIPASGNDDEITGNLRVVQSNEVIPTSTAHRQEPPDGDPIRIFRQRAEHVVAGPERDADVVTNRQ